MKKIRPFLLLGAHISVQRAQEGETEVRAKGLPWEGASGPGGLVAESRVDTRCVEWVLKGAGDEKRCCSRGRGVSPLRRAL